MHSGYNSRLFSKGIRKRIHLARFFWLEKQAAKYAPHAKSVLEIGCFDGRSIEYLPTPPMKYFGYDANWEGGLDIARHVFRENQNYCFRYAERPEDLIPVNDQVDLCISLETLEHIAPDFIPEYIKYMHGSIKPSGILIVTVPNEKGLIFLLKYLIKKYYTGDAEKYTLKEIFNAAIGNMKGVERNQHKGFDWSDMLAQLGKDFELIQAEGIQLPWLPLWVNLQIGFIMKPRAH
ncbi:class I SAM-dependent methyltransferase [Parathermosynechococcus lividus]